MQPDDARIGAVLRGWLYGVFGLLFFTGVGWMLLHALARTEGEFGSQPHPAESWSLRLHGAGAMAVLVILGILLPLHVRRGWRAGGNRLTGVIMVGSCLILTLTGYALYYAGSDRQRDLAIWIHEAVGLGFPVLVGWHILWGRRSRRPPPLPE